MVMDDTRPSLIRLKRNPTIFTFSLGYLGQVITFGAVYFLVARLGFLIPFNGQLSVLVWPATGLAFAVLTRSGIRYWPGAALGALLVALSNQYSIPLLIGFVAAHTLEPLVGAYVLRRHTHFRSSLEKVNDVLALVIIGAFLSALLGASVGTLAIRLSPEGVNRIYSYVWWEWWAGHTISIVSIAPVVLTWYANRRMNWTVNQWIEAGIGLVGLVLISAVVFLQFSPSGNYPLGHAVFPFLLWFALRFGPREVASASLVTLIIGIWGTATGTGPFSRSNPDLNVLLLLSFVLSVILTALIVSSVLAQLRRAREALRQNNAQLEARVTARTAELSQANNLLQQNIIERDQIHGELVHARDQALDALRLKSQILANISHDARTPLNVIMLRTEMMQVGRYGAITDKQKETLDGISLNARELLTFINNLLDEAQYDTKKLRPVPVEFKPHDWLKQSVDAMRPLAEQKHLQLMFRVAEDMPSTLNNDPEWLRKILNNLLSNAIKFTAKGHVCINVNKVDANHWLLMIEDSGMGIPDEALPHIFEAFWQGDGSVTRDTNRGVGLGLSIVKRLTRILGGEIVVESQVGQGSIFKVTLPFEMKKEADEHG